MACGQANAVLGRKHGLGGAPVRSRGARATTPRRVVVQCTATSYDLFPKRDARLVLEDGSIWRGIGFGAKKVAAVGEVVFNTSLTGYQEILTDPSYFGQSVVMTCPQIGNTGINEDDMESKDVYLGGFIVRQLTRRTSNYRSQKSLDDYLAEKGIPGIAEIDTRAITRRLRDTGSLNGVLCTDESVSDEELVEKAKSYSIVGEDLISQVTTKEVYEWKERTDDEWEFAPGATEESQLHVVAYDFGVKHNILRRLASYGAKVTVVPSTTPASEVMALNPDGVFLSNGPGDPSAVPYAVENVKELLGQRPMFGICMGHQVLGQALGASTFKLKFGHHGGNHPIRRSASGTIEISSQNHNFAIDPATLPSDVQVSHVNLNDNTCAGLLCPAKMAMGIQYHPEASPGPHDADPSFANFFKMMKEYKESQ